MNLPLKNQRPDNVPTLREALKRFNFKLALTLAALIIVFIAVFRLLKLYDLYLVAIVIYTAVTLAAAIYYIVYNRGVLSGKVTPDMLPAEWSAEQKQAMIDDIAARQKRSKWVLLILIPMIFVFGFELLELYFFPLITSLFSGS